MDKLSSFINSKKFEYILLTLVFVIWLAITIFTGLHHEPWADEAQAWLIAKHNSYLGLFNVLKWEGHPLNWYFVLHTLSLLGLKYKWLFVVSLSFSAIGVFLFLFKTDIPKFIKILVPFSYPLLYQYTVVSRNYCLIFPILMAYVVLYNKYKYSKPYIIALLLILLMGTHVYTIAISGFLFLLWITDCIKNKKVTHLFIISLICIILYFAFTVSYLHTENVYFYHYFFTGYDIWHFKDMLKFVSYSLIYPRIENIYIILGVVFLYLIMIFSFYGKNWKKSIVLILFISAYEFVYSNLYSNAWHFEILFLFLIFIFCLDFNEKNKYIKTISNKIFYCSLSIVLLISAYYGMTTSVMDIQKPYSPAKYAAIFLKRYSSEKVYAISFKTVAVQPYFEKQIYINYTDKWYNWTNFLEYPEPPFIEIINEIQKENPKVIVSSIDSKNYYYFKQYLKNKHIKYEEYIIDTEICYKNDVYEGNSLSIIQFK